MSENNYGALMLKSVLANGVDAKKITAPGIYPVTQGNTSVPDSSAGLLTVALLPSGVTITFQKQNSAVIYTLTGGNWVKPDADDVVAVPSVIRGVINGSMTMASANKSGWWQVAVPDTSKVSDFPKKPNGSKLYGYGYMFVWITSNTWFQHYFAHHGEVAYRQDWSAGPSASTSWVVEYNTANKPTAAEVDAVSASGGGTFKGVVNFNSIVRIDKSYPGLVLRDADTGDSVVGKDIILEASGSNVRLLFRKKDVTDNQLMLSFPKVTGTLYSTGNKPSAGDVGAYSKSEGDARYQAKGNYTPAGQAYTKAESDARYVQNMQRGAATSPGKANEYGPNEAPTGCVLTRAWHDASTSYGVLFTYRPLQIYINGAWRTITG